MKRIGYIGLSTPSFYDYKHQASPAAADDHSSPNPIIEGAFGALLLYDELWFFCRSLCPENMRNLGYVKFLDELDQIPDVDYDWLPSGEEIFSPDALKIFRESSSRYDDVKKQANVYWDAAADNHTHGLNVGGKHFSGNSWNIRNVIFDTLLSQRFSENVELITNGFTARLFEQEASTRDRLILSEVLLLDEVPQFLGPKGPYHECLEEVRNNQYLKYFRDWIQIEGVSASAADISDMKRKVEEELKESQRKIFMKWLDPRGGYSSLAQTVIGTGIDALVPGASVVKDLFAQYKDEKTKQDLRWQGFLLDSRIKIQNRK